MRTWSIIFCISSIAVIFWMMIISAFLGSFVTKVDVVTIKGEELKYVKELFLGVDSPEIELLEYKRIRSIFYDLGRGDVECTFKISEEYYDVWSNRKTALDFRIQKHEDYYILNGSCSPYNKITKGIETHGKVFFYFSKRDRLNPVISPIPFFIVGLSMSLSFALASFYFRKRILVERYTT